MILFHLCTTGSGMHLSPSYTLKTKHKTYFSILFFQRVYAYCVSQYKFPSFFCFRLRVSFGWFLFYSYGIVQMFGFSLTSLTFRCMCVFENTEYWSIQTINRSQSAFGFKQIKLSKKCSDTFLCALPNKQIKRFTLNFLI